MNSVDLYAPSRLSIDMEGASFVPRTRKPTLHDLQTQLDSALKAKDDFAMACLPNSVRQGLGQVALKTCRAGVVGGVVVFGLSVFVAVIDALELARSGEDKHGICMDSRLQEIGALAATAVLAGSLAWACDKGAAYFAQRVDQETQETLQRLQEKVDSAHGALARAICQGPFVEFREALEQTDIPAHHLIEALGDDTSRQLIFLEHLATHGLWTGHGVRKDDRTCGFLRSLGEDLLTALDDTNFVHEHLLNSPALAHILAIVALSPSAWITDVPEPLLDHLRAHRDVLNTALALMAAFAEDFHVPRDVLTLLTGHRGGGIPNALFNLTQLPNNG